MEKTAFLTKVAEVMKGLMTYDTMMGAINRSCMRPLQENMELMVKEEKAVDELITGVTVIEEIKAPEEVLDVLALRYLKNTQFLARVKEKELDSEGLADDLAFWKKTMTFKVPQ
jgi:hypothetical protein